MGGQTPKQFLPLCGTAIIARTIGVFEALSDVHEVVVVVPPQYIERTRRIVLGYGFKKVTNIIAGGRERQDSVHNGLHAFNREPDIILVHDAVRPLILPSTVKEVIRETIRHRAAVVGVRVKDTIKVEGKQGFYQATLERSKLWAVQTPQGFSYKLLMRAHETAKKSRFLGTDESSLVERMGIPVRIVEGEHGNIKITTTADLLLATGFLGKKSR